MAWRFSDWERRPVQEAGPVGYQRVRTCLSGCLLPFWRGAAKVVMVCVRSLEFFAVTSVHTTSASATSRQIKTSHLGFGHLDFFVIVILLLRFFLGRSFCLPLCKGLLHHYFLGRFLCLLLRKGPSVSRERTMPIPQEPRCQHRRIQYLCASVNRTVGGGGGAASSSSSSSSSAQPGRIGEKSTLPQTAAQLPSIRRRQPLI